MRREERAWGAVSSVYGGGGGDWDSPPAFRSAVSRRALTSARARPVRASSRSVLAGSPAGAARVRGAETSFVPAIAHVFEFEFELELELELEFEFEFEVEVEVEFEFECEFEGGRGREREAGMMRSVWLVVGRDMRGGWVVRAGAASEGEAEEEEEKAQKTCAESARRSEGVRDAVSASTSDELRTRRDIFVGVNGDWVGSTYVGVQFA